MESIHGFICVKGGGWAFPLSRVFGYTLFWARHRLEVVADPNINNTPAHVMPRPHLTSPKWLMWNLQS